MWEPRSSTAEDTAAIAALIRHAFALPEPLPVPSLHRDHLHWKYFAPRESWPGVRSYVAEVDGRLAAHVAAWPMRVATRRSGVLCGAHPIDWVAAKSAKGAGSQMLTHLMRHADFLIAIGVTEGGQKSMARFGFFPRDEIRYCVLPLRPWLQLRTHTRRDWKLLPRFVRNSFWRSRANFRAPDGWTARSISTCQLPDELLPTGVSTALPGLRTKDDLGYLLSSPTVKHELYLVSYRAAPSGYFILSETTGQARIAEAWSVNPQPDHWKALYQLALETALGRSGCAEILAASSNPLTQTAFDEIGFRVYRRLPVMVYDPQNHLQDEPSLHLQMDDNDFSFLHGGKTNYES